MHWNHILRLTKRDEQVIPTSPAADQTVIFRITANDDPTNVLRYEKHTGDKVEVIADKTEGERLFNAAVRTSAEETP